MGRLSRVAVGLTVVTVLFLFSAIANASSTQCWSSTGGNGTTWLSGKVTAGGSAAKDVNVTLNPKTWASGYSYMYESVCSDSSGNFAFKTETSPATDCYSTYTYSGTSTSYCNYRSARCYQQCYSDNKNSYYTNSTVSLEGYVLKTYLPYNSSIADNYGVGESSSFTIDFSGSKTINITLPEKNITMRIRVKDGAGNAVTSGLTVYVSGPSYSSKSIGSSFTDVYAVAGTYYIGAYCTDWQNCNYACITNTNVELKDSDANTTKEINLTAKSSNATIAGIVRGSDSAAISGAYVSVSNYSSGSDGCSAYGYNTTNASGSYSVKIPPGTYTVYVSPPWSSGGTSYSNAEESATLTADQTTTKNITLLKKDGTISGTVKDSNGNGINNAWVSAWTYSEGTGTRDWASGQTDSSGKFSLGAVKGSKYNVQAYYWNSAANSNDQDVSNCSKEGMVTVEAPASDVKFTFQSWNHTVSFAFVDADGKAISGVSGGGSIRLQSDSDNSSYCGTWVNFDSGSAKKKLSADTKYIIEPYTWGATSYDPEGKQVKFTSGGAGGSSNVNITMVAVNSTVSGKFLDDAGREITPASNYMNVYATKGNLWRSCTSSTSSYECKVSKGNWCVGYWLDWNSGYASLAPGTASSCVDVGASESKTYDLSFLKKGDVNVTVVDNNGTAKKWVWVQANAFSADDQEDDAEKRRYWGNGCSTDSNGKCTIPLGAKADGTTYYLTAYRPWNELNSEGITLPEEVKVTVKPGESVNASNLVFRIMDGELEVTASAATAASTSLNPDISLVNPVLNASADLATDIASSAYISCFSSMGGYAEATADASGKATIKCTSSDEWHCVGVNQLGNNLYISEEGAAVCLPSPTKTPLTLVLSAAGTIPDAVNLSWDAGSANSISLDDKFSISFNAAALGSSGTTVSCKVQPDPLVPYQSGKRPSNKYGYNITCSDSNGVAITAFNSEATLCLPVDDTVLKNLGLVEADCSLVYRDPSTDAYIALNSVTIDATNNTVCGKTNHLTEFVIVGNGNLSAIDGDKETASQECSRTGDSCSGSEVGGGSAAAAGGAGGCSCDLSKKGFDAEQLLYFIVFLSFYIALRRKVAPLLTRNSLTKSVYNDREPPVS